MSAIGDSNPSLVSPTHTTQDKSPVFSDELAEPRYVVEIDRTGANKARPPSPPARTLSMTDRAGRAYACAVPAAGGDDEDGGDGSSTTTPSTDARSPSTIVAAALASTCQVRHEDWWTYEFCFGRHVRQFHVDGGGVAAVKDAAGVPAGDVTDEFLLGVANATASTVVDDAPATDPAAPPAQATYVAAVYGGGAPCDLTGGQRAAEVRFVCPGDGTSPTDAAPGAPAATGAAGAPVLLSAREPATCSYVVTVGVPALCGHAAFRRVEPPTATIVCRPKEERVLDE